jgi:Tol biopolymer transport system component
MDIEEKIRIALEERATRPSATMRTWPDIEHRLDAELPGSEHVHPEPIGRRLVTIGVALAVFSGAALFAWTAFRGSGPTSVPSNASSVAPNLAGGRILFSVRDNGDGSEDVYSMAPDGSDVLPLLTGSADDSGAVWSPDGTRFAFVRIDRNGPCTDSNIYVADADGSNQVQLTGDPEDLQCDVPSLPSPAPDGIVSVATGVGEDEPAWSPDGTRIAMRSDDCGIKVVSVDGSDSTCLTPDGSYASEPIWSPDGSRIAFDSDRDLPNGAFGSEIWIMDADGSNPVRVTHDGGGNIVSGWSPDGSSLVYQRSVNHSDYGWDVWTIGVDGTGSHQVTDWAGYDGNAVFSPDGRYVAFASDRFGGSAAIEEGEGGGYAHELDVYTVAIGGGDATRLTSYAPLTAWPTGWATATN